MQRLVHTLRVIYAEGCMNTTLIYLFWPWYAHLALRLHWNNQCKLVWIDSGVYHNITANGHWVLIFYNTGCMMKLPKIAHKISQPKWNTFSVEHTILLESKLIRDPKLCDTPLITGKLDKCINYAVFIFLASCHWINHLLLHNYVQHHCIINLSTQFFLL